MEKEDLSLGSPKFFGTDMTKQVPEGSGSINPFLLEREQNGGWLLLRKGRGSGDRKVHSIYSDADYSNGRVSVNALSR